MWRDTDGSGASALGDGERGETGVKDCTDLLGLVEYFEVSVTVHPDQIKSKPNRACVCVHTFIHTYIYLGAKVPRTTLMIHFTHGPLRPVLEIADTRRRVNR